MDLPRVSKMSEKQAALLLKSLDVPVIGTVVAALMYGLLAATLLRKRIVTQHTECELKTISEVMRDHNLESIDLMKVDVEGSELDMILGIADEDWPKIRQFVIEVHDIDGRVARIQAILESRGYKTTVEQLDFEVLKILKNYTIYAVRAA